MKRLTKNAARCMAEAKADEDVRRLRAQVEMELGRAMVNYPPFSSAHEGYAVLLEEVDELWAEVKKSPKNRDMKAMREEAIQVAAMAMRFVLDVCDEDV